MTSHLRSRSGEGLVDPASTSALSLLGWTLPLFLSLYSHLSTSHFSLFIARPPSPPSSLPPSLFSSFLLCNNPSALHPPTVFSTPRILWELSKNRRERSEEAGAEMNSSDNFIKYTDSDFHDPSGPLNPTCSRCLRQPLTSDQFHLHQRRGATEKVGAMRMQMCPLPPSFIRLLSVYAFYRRWK